VSLSSFPQSKVTQKYKTKTPTNNKHIPRSLRKKERKTYQTTWDLALAPLAQAALIAVPAAAAAYVLLIHFRNNLSSSCANKS
jgi:hypothetical protein